jgi:hypothetical protein
MAAGSCWCSRTAIGSTLSPGHSCGCSGVNWSLSFGVGHSSVAGACPLEFRELLRAAELRYLKLAPLPQRETLALVRRSLGVTEMPAELERFILKKGHGNPFFSEEWAFALRDAGLLLIVEGQCRLSDSQDLESLNLPDNVQGIVTARIDRLEPAEQLVLKVASVIGRGFRLRILRDVFPLDEFRQHLSKYLKPLEKLDLTLLDKPEPDRAYIFKHATTREATYNLMLFTQRRQLHRAVAEWYESHERADLSLYFTLLAHHWSAAEDWQRALEYLDQAGDQAVRSHASEEVLTFFGRALRLAENVESVDANRRARWHHALAEASYDLGDCSSSQKMLYAAATLLGEAGPRTKLGQLMGLLWQLICQLLFRFRGLPQNMAPAGRRLDAAHVYERLAQIHYMDNEKLAAILCALRALNLVERCGVSAALARSYANMSIVAGLGSLDALAERYCRYATGTAGRLADRSCDAYVLEVTSIYRTGVGKWKEALHGLNAAASIGEEIGDLRRWDGSLFGIGCIDYRLGLFDSCRQHFRALKASGQRRNIAQVELWGLAGLLGALIPINDGSEEDLQGARKLTDGVRRWCPPGSRRSCIRSGLLVNRSLASRST